MLPQLLALSASLSDSLKNRTVDCNKRVTFSKIPIKKRVYWNIEKIATKTNAMNSGKAITRMCVCAFLYRIPPKRSEGRKAYYNRKINKHLFSKRTPTNVGRSNLMLRRSGLLILKSRN